MRRSAHLGYTLLELMVVVGVAGILATTFGSVMFFQVSMYMQRLDEADAHQTARGAFNAIRHSAQGARYGFGQSPNAVGSVAVGRCAQNSGSASQGACLNADYGKFDRLRLVSIVNDKFFVGNSNFTSAGPCSATSTTTDPNHINFLTTPTTNTSTTTAYAIGGNCLDANVGAATDLITLSGSSGGTNGCGYAGNFTRLEDGLATLSCPTGYAKGFAFGNASIRDYFVVQDTVNPNNYNLMLRTLPYSNLSTTTAQQVLVYNVSSFKVRYLIDYDTPPDHRADNILLSTCTDPRTTADGGNCPNVDSLGNTLTTQQLYNRITGIQVTLGVRSATQRKNLVGPTVVNGYRTWTYMSQFSIRNNGT